MTNSESNNPTTEKIAATEALVWEQSPYYEDAEKFMWVFWNWHAATEDTVSMF
jgi:hypothetical protein